MRQRVLGSVVRTGGRGHAGPPGMLRHGWTRNGDVHVSGAVVRNARARNIG